MATQSDKLISCNDSHNYQPPDQADVDEENIISLLRETASECTYNASLSQTKIHNLNRREE